MVVARRHGVGRETDNQEIRNIWYSDIVFVKLLWEGDFGMLFINTKINACNLRLTETPSNVGAGNWSDLCPSRGVKNQNGTITRKYVTGPEDPRAVATREGVAIAFSSMPPREWGCPEQPVSKFFLHTTNYMHGDLAQTQNAVELDCSERANKEEKNWIGFEYQGHLMWVYTVEPHVVVEARRQDGKCARVHGSTYAPLAKFQLDNPNKQVHGSGVAVPWELCQPRKSLRTLALERMDVHDGSKCGDQGNDCCASETWGEPQTCRDGYQAQSDPSCRHSAFDGCRTIQNGIGCYGCFPTEYSVELELEKAEPEGPQIESCYLAAFHTLDKASGEYRHFFYTFSAEPPFDVIAIASEPISLAVAAPDANTQPFAFLSGLARHPDRSEVLVSYGAGDRQSRVRAMSDEQVFAHFNC